MLHVHQLANGLTLLAEPMAAVQSAAFSLVLPAGAAYEPANRPGAASMMVEWAMRGAGERDSRALVSALDDLGVSHGESAQTVHSSFAAATLSANLLDALEIFADVVQRPLLDEDEIEPIRALALQSLQSLEDDPGSKVMIELRRRFFPDPWGRSASGSSEGVKAATAQDLRQFFQDAFRPNGAILAVAGRLSWPELLDTVERCFGGWKPRVEPTLLLKAVGSRREHITKETHQTQIALGFPSVTVHDPGYYEARAFASILGGYASARLFTEVREKRGLCYSVSAGYESLREMAGVLCYAGTSTERAQQTLDVTLAEIQRLARQGIEQEELETMRAGLKSGLIMQQESSMSRSSSLAADWYHLGRVRSLDEISTALDALTVESVSAFARTQRVDDLTIVTLGASPLKLPSESGSP